MIVPSSKSVVMLVSSTHRVQVLSLMTQDLGTPQLYAIMLDMKDIVRSRPAEVRDEHGSLKEPKIVQSNIMLFEGACEGYGALPCISISDMAALASPFITRHQEESYW